MSKFVTSDEWLLEDYADFLEIEGGPFQKAGENDVSFYEITMMQMIWADEIHFSKVADALTTYLVDLIACVYRNTPDLIPSKARFDLNFVRKFRTINDAVRGSALAELERLSRSGFWEILAEAERVTRCTIPSDLNVKIRHIVKLRNEIVHKQGRYQEIIGSMFGKREKPKSLIKHRPGDTTKAEYVACEVVGLFEAAAIKSGIPIVATKSEMFKGIDFLK